MEAFARLAAPGEPERAAKLWGAAESLRDSLGLPLPPNELEEYDRNRAAAREALGEEAFARAGAAGRAMTVEQAIEYALQDDPAQGSRLRAHGFEPAAPEPCTVSPEPPSTLPLLTTKLDPPALLPSLLPRPRLTARLDPTGSARLALLVAPAGSGKSSLLSQWSQQQPGGIVAWLSLDAEDGDPARFLLYLGAALERVAPRRQRPPGPCCRRISTPRPRRC
jgi:hypothetical protein